MPTNPYPVHLEAEPADRYTRMQLLVRVVASVALGALGISIGTVFAIAFCLLPIYAASRIASLGSAPEYARQDGPRVMRVLHWFLAVSAWMGLVVEALPARGPEEMLHVGLDPTPVRASPIAALLRMLTGLASALVLGLLSCLGTFVWLWAAICILVREGVGAGAFAYLVGLQRWSLRLLAYQACLVDQYPPFSFGDGTGAANANQHRIVPV